MSRKVLERKLRNVAFRNDIDIEELLNGSIKDAIDRLQAIWDAAVAKGLTDVIISIDNCYYEGSLDMAVTGKRPETDAEMNRRIENWRKRREREKKQKQNERELRKAQYEKLKKEFGDE